MNVPAAVVGTVMLLGLLRELKGKPRDELPDVLVLDSWTVVSTCMMLPAVQPGHWNSLQLW